jgi:predicted alpha/beta superfamily hydrolase/Tol biopolymer transport system component
MPMTGRTAFFLVAVLALGGPSTEAQAPSLPIPVRVETLASVKVGEPREFWVSLPDRYNASTERYPVLYMMDGDFNFNSGVIGGVRQAAWMGEIPEFIIVGIKNTNRSKDIFPEEVTYPDGSKDGGRANQYLDFVREELIPQVARTYRTTDYRILYGTSNTGFTAVHALFRNPDLANAYIAASATLSVPSFRSARDNLVGTFKGGRRELVLVMGEYDYPTVVSHNGILKETIATKAPAGLACRLRVIENGEHVPPDALVEGLRALFQGWKVIRPLTESSFAETRAQVDGRLEKFGVPGRIDEDALKGLGNSLLGEKRVAKALEVLEYRAASYPQSADAQVGLGDAYRQSGNMEKARECYQRALVIAPGHAAAAAKLKEVGMSASAQEKVAGYIDQAPPEQTPRVFSLQTHDGYFASDRIAVSADGKELYYTEVTSTWSDYNIRYYKYADQKWNGPFDLFPGFLGPALSVDGKTMSFEKYNDSRTCWHSKRIDAGWSTPTLCTEPPDPKDKHYLQDTASGRIYASSRGALNGIGQMDISTLGKTDATGGWHSLGRPLNSPGNEGDFYVARDEAFIVFGSPHRGGFGGGDLFISFRERDGSWSDPKNLGATINTPGYEFGPYVTDDKRYLFFSRSSDFTRVDVYWVRFDRLLETLRRGTTPSDLPALAGQQVARPVIGTVKSPPKGAYFGQALPGDTPVLFAPEVLTSLNAWVEATAFSPDGTQFVVSVGAPDYTRATLYYSTRVNGEWTPIVKAPFVSDFTYSNEPVFSADGKTLMFTGKKSAGSLDLWTVEYGDHKWVTPVALPSPINSDAVEYRGSYMSDGTLYFTSGRSGVNQIYRVRKDATRALGVELVAAPISTGSPEGDPCIAPDGRFLIFNSARDWKSADLYVSVRDGRGGWGPPVKLGPEFNSPDDEYGAHLSSDGKYLFFTRHTSQGNQIYWVAVSAIETLGPR